MMHKLMWLQKLPNKPMIIAEIKRMSPYGWVNGKTTAEQLAICEQFGDVISVHTSEYWGGSWGHLKMIRRMTAKPILAKGFHPTIMDVKTALDYGADYVLTVGWWPSCTLGEKCWHEIESLSQMLNTEAATVVVNARCPRTGGKNPHGTNIGEVVKYNNPYRKRLIQASHIRGPGDVHPKADGILIGQGLFE